MDGGGIEQVSLHLPAGTATFMLTDIAGSLGIPATNLPGELLASVQLLTLTAAGGCGKTRLALQAAAAAMDDHPYGVWWVEVARLEDAALLPAAVIGAIGMREVPGSEPLETPVDFLRTRRTLLILDNCEHLVAACAQLADALVRICPSVTARRGTAQGVWDMATHTAQSALRIDNLSEYDRVFQDAFNAGDLEELVSLYEPEAVFIPSPGQVAAGTDSLRAAFAGFLATKPSFELKMTSLYQVGDIALESSEWKLEGNDPDGNPMALGGTCSAVLRRQVDGRWLFVIDNPFTFV